MRIIPEWKDYDQEIKDLQERYDKGFPPLDKPREDKLTDKKHGEL